MFLYEFVAAHIWMHLKHIVHLIFFLFHDLYVRAIVTCCLYMYPQKCCGDYSLYIDMINLQKVFFVYRFVVLARTLNVVGLANI